MVRRARLSARPARQRRYIIPRGRWSAACGCALERAVEERDEERDEEKVHFPPSFTLTPFAPFLTLSPSFSSHALTLSASASAGNAARAAVRLSLRRARPAACRGRPRGRRRFRNALTAGERPSASLSLPPLSLSLFPPPPPPVSLPSSKMRVYRGRAVFSLLLLPPPFPSLRIDDFPR